MHIYIPCSPLSGLGKDAVGLDQPRDLLMSLVYTSKKKLFKL